MTAKKKAKAKKPALSATLKALVAGAAIVGFTSANAFAGGVDLCRKLAKSRSALNDAGIEYKAGYVARYLRDERAMVRRWGNMDDAQIIDEARSIYGKPYPESSKSNRRTELEHKACRAADVSWASCKRRAGLIAEKKGGRKPRPSANKPNPIPVDLVKASPRLKDRAAANDYFATAAAALLATCDKNAKHVPPQISSAVSDFKAQITAFLNPAA